MRKIGTTDTFDRWGYALSEIFNRSKKWRSLSKDELKGIINTVRASKEVLREAKRRGWLKKTAIGTYTWDEQYDFPDGDTIMKMVENYQEKLKQKRTKTQLNLFNMENSHAKVPNFDATTFLESITELNSSQVDILDSISFNNDNVDFIEVNGVNMECDAISFIQNEGKRIFAFNQFVEPGLGLCSTNGTIIVDADKFEAIRLTRKQTDDIEDIRVYLLVEILTHE